MIPRFPFDRGHPGNFGELIRFGGNQREFAFLGILALCVLAMGLYPFPFTEVMHTSVNELLRHVAVSKL